MLRRPDRSHFLQLRILLDYVVLHNTGSSSRMIYRAEFSRYMYSVLDLNGREIFAYHCHPGGLSDVWTPHFHVTAAPSVELPVRNLSPEPADLHLGKVHFPTHRVSTAELVRFLITELNVAPRRPDWEAVLDEIRR